ncbi:MAG: ATP-binding protein, partial [Candidatus Kariarchaeaceae archaeon]
ELNKKIQNEKGITKVYHNVGVIYRLQGDPIKALPYFEYSLKLKKKMGDIEGMTWDLQYIGMIKFELAEYNEAREKFEECYEIRKKLANKIQLSEILFLSISVYVILGLDELVKQKFSELSIIHDTVESSIVHNHYLLSQIKVKQSSRIMKRVLENEIYEEILRKNVVDVEHTQEAEVGHCNFMLLEYKSNNDDTTLGELRTFIADLYDKARFQENYQLLVDILVIEAKISALQNEFHVAFNFMKNATDIAEDKNLVKQKLELSFALKEIAEDYTKFQTMQGKHPNTESADQEIDSYIELLTENLEYDSESAEIFASDEKEIIEANLKFTELIKRDGKLPSETKDTLHFLELSLWDYRLLSNSYNVLFRIENAAYYSHPELFDISDLLTERLLVFEQKQVNKKINLVDYQSQDNFELEVDKNLVVLIYDNLLQNAMKFTPEGGLVEIKFKYDTDHIVLEFSNDCPLVPDWILPKLFDKYTQWHFDEHVRKLGIGIGLNFIKSAVNYLGGSVEFISPNPSEKDGVLIRIVLPEKMFQSIDQ